MFNTSNGYSLSDIAAVSGSEGFGGGGAWWIIILFLFCFNGGWGNGTGRGTESITQALDTNSIKNSVTDGFYAVNSSLLNGFANTNATVSNGFAGVSNSLCSGFAGVNSNINNSSRDIMAEMANMNYGNLQNTYTISNQMNALSQAQQMGTCQTNQLLAANHADLTYKLATEACENRRTTADGTRDIIEASNANTRAILDFLTQTKIDDLNAENASLRSAISQAEQNAYLVNALGSKAAIPAYVVQNPNASYSPCSSCNGYSY